MLRCETNTPEIMEEILDEAKAYLGIRPNAFFEHGQWWVIDTETYAVWSVNDTDSGYDFEQMSKGDEE